MSSHPFPPVNIREDGTADRWYDYGTGSNYQFTPHSHSTFTLAHDTASHCRHPVGGKGPVSFCLFPLNVIAKTADLRNTRLFIASWLFLHHFTFRYN